MHWIEESRRIAFEHGEQGRAKERAASSEWNEITPDLDRAIPKEIRLRAVAIGNELIFSYDDALIVTGIATEKEIAVLGFDSGEVLEDGFQIMDYSGYEANVPLANGWKAYIEAMNIEAGRWVREHPLGKNHGYILTSASQREFDGVKRQEMKPTCRSARKWQRS
jgi:hypothetical protein